MADLPPPSPRATAAAYLLVACAIIGAIILLIITRPRPAQITIQPPEPTATPQPTRTPSPLTIYVTGAVAAGDTLVTVPAGSRVSDAIEAAGGATADADLQRVNLAGLLRDGDQVHIPAQGGAEVTLATPSGSDLVRVNTAEAEELMTLPGIGPALAAAIIADREQNGPFLTPEDLIRVRGIGPALLASIIDRISLDQ
jgi:competence protein ComEA